METTENQLQLLDATFKWKHTSKYHLNVRIGANSLSYAIFNPAKNKYIGLFDYREVSNLQYVILEDELLQQTFAKIRVALPSEKQTIIPSAIFDASLLKEYAELNFGESSTGMLTDHLVNLPAKILHLPTQEMLLDADLYFQGADFYYDGTPLLEGIMSQNTGSDKSVVYIFVDKNFIDIVFVNQGNLQLYNRFNYSSLEEFLYYPSFIFQQLGLDRTQTEIVLLGMIDINSESYQLLSKYFKYIEFGELPGNFSYGKKLGEIPQHYFYPIISLELCG